jgi:NAD(P)H-dependent FMN reductase
MSKLLVLVGSTHVGGFNDRLADLAVRDLPTDVEVSRFDLATLPFYDEVADGEGRLGEAVDAFRAAVADADAILFTSPAYNGTLTGVAKNAIDVASRPRGAAPIVDKPVLVTSAVYSPGADERVVEHARIALSIAGARPLEQTFTVTKHVEAFDETGLVDKARERELQSLVADLLAPVTV